MILHKIYYTKNKETSYNNITTETKHNLKILEKSLTSIQSLAGSIKYSCQRLRMKHLGTSMFSLCDYLCLK